MSERVSEYTTNALDNLRVHQRQLDADGTEVGVSREALNEVIRAFGELSSRSGGVAVKGLEWHLSVGGESDPVVEGAWWADTGCGRYIVRGVTVDGDGWFLLGRTGWNKTASVDEAKAAAQADYERRILSTLSPALEGEPVAWVAPEVIARLKSGRAASHVDLSSARGNVFTQPLYASTPEPVETEAYDDYDAGLLNDFGGGNVEWWQDYLRAEIGRANDFWREQIVAATSPEPVEVTEEVDPLEIEKLNRRWHGEVHRIISVRWEPYKPDGRRQMGVPGRWQEQVGSGDYWRWQNCERPENLTAALKREGK